MNIEAKNVSKSFGRQVVLDDVSCVLYKGEIVGLLGRNGAGKSTFLKILAGINLPDNGMIDTDDCAIGYMSERNPLYPYMYVQEYLMWIASVKKIDDKTHRVRTIIDQVGLKEVEGKLVRQLSKGYKQRLGLAATLLPDPEVIILDEPISGLDPIQITAYRALIKSISSEKVIVLSSHLLQEIEALCDRVLLIKEGKISDTSGGLADLSKSKLKVSLSDSISTELLAAISGVLSVESLSDDQYALEFDPSIDIRSDVFDCVVAENLKILEMYRDSRSFNALFK